MRTNPSPVGRAKTMLSATTRHESSCGRCGEAGDGPVRHRRRGGPVKANQPRPYAVLKKLPWTQVPAHTAVTTGHERRARRTIKEVTAPAWVNFVGAAQVAQIRRTVSQQGRKSVEVVYIITSADHKHATPATPADWGTGALGHWGTGALGHWGHWGIENQLHWVRDVT